MEPLLLICPGCAARVRAKDPARARASSCPRCGTPLAAAVDRTLRLDPGRVAPADDWTVAAAPEGWRARLIFAGAAVLGLASVIHLFASSISVPMHSAAPVAPRLAGAASRLSWPAPANAPASAESEPGPIEMEPEAEPAPPEPAVVAAPEAPVGLALRGPADPEPGAGPEPGDADIPPRPPAPVAPRPAGQVGADGSPPPPPTPAPSAAEPRRLLVRDAAGKAVVAREHGTLKGRTAVVLPDGTIGWPTTRVTTDEPFRPSTMDELDGELRGPEGEYADFRSIKTEHYLLCYQSTERFARESADLLEKLFENLTGALRKQKLPVTPAEFPLVAVVFRSEEDFRASRQVAPEVQAYYDILSNRIYFYEKSSREAASPELTALRKPQTVAHEGTHQLLHNVGIQPRMSPWPIWLVEGLAEYCAPPKLLKKGTAWAGLGQVNAVHLTTIRDLDDPMSSEVRGGPKAPSTRDRSRPLVEYLATRTDLTPTDYALSWGLTHYLAQKQVDPFVAYIRKLNQLKPFEERTPEEQLADFRAAFGDLAKLDAAVGKHLARLKVPEGQAMPFYAVLVEQPGRGGSVRRMAMVSQSPSVIRQWVETASNQVNGQIQWQALAHPNRTRAMMTADGWIHPGH